jgi:hypothetical protein
MLPPAVAVPLGTPEKTILPDVPGGAISTLTIAVPSALPMAACATALPGATIVPIAINAAMSLKFTISPACLAMNAARQGSGRRNVL